VEEILKEHLEQEATQALERVRVRWEQGQGQRRGQTLRRPQRGEKEWKRRSGQEREKRKDKVRKTMSKDVKHKGGMTAL